MKEGFATTLVDLGRNQIFDVVQGRTVQSLESDLKRLKRREDVTLVVMDLSETYRASYGSIFPMRKAEPWRLAGCEPLQRAKS